MVTNIQTKATAKSQEVIELENELNKLIEEKKDIEANNYFNRLADDKFFRLELLKVLDNGFAKMTASIENIPSKVAELTNPQ